MPFYSTENRSSSSQDSESDSEIIVDRTHADLPRFEGYDKGRIYVIPSLDEDREPQFDFSVYSHNGNGLDANTIQTLYFMDREADEWEQTKRKEDKGLKEDEISTVDYQGKFTSGLKEWIPEEGSRVELLPEATQDYEMVAHGFKRMALPWDEVNPEEEAISEELSEALSEASKLLGVATDGNEQGDRITA